MSQAHVNAANHEAHFTETELHLDSKSQKHCIAWYHVEGVSQKTETLSTSRTKSTGLRACVAGEELVKKTSSANVCRSYHCSASHLGSFSRESVSSHSLPGALG